MKRNLTLGTGMAFILTFGLAFATEDMSESNSTVDDTICDQDTHQPDMDQERPTVKRMPTESDTAGSGAGGMNKDSESTYKNNDRSIAPDENTSVKCYVEGSAPGGSRDDSYSPSY